jgi:hypothetical protein
MTNRSGKGVATLELQVMNKAGAAVSIDNCTPKNKRVQEKCSGFDKKCIANMRAHVARQMYLYARRIASNKERLPV